MERASEDADAQSESCSCVRLRLAFSPWLRDGPLPSWGITREGGVLKSPSSDYKAPAYGAATTIWCCLSPQLAGRGGVYCEECDIAGLVPNDSPALYRSGIGPWTHPRQWPTPSPQCRYNAATMRSNE